MSELGEKVWVEILTPEQIKEDLNGPVEYAVMARPVFANAFFEESRHDTREDAEFNAVYWRAGGCDVHIKEVPKEREE